MKLYLDLENRGCDNGQNWNVTVNTGKGIGGMFCSSGNQNLRCGKV